MESAKIHDLIGIGFGPSNIALAIALSEMNAEIDYVFLEKCDGSHWQDGMLLDGSDIQNNPLRDLVTPRNPCSSYSFVNYLQVSGRLLEFLNLGSKYPLRKDYARYVSWAAGQFDDHVRYGSNVDSIHSVADDGVSGSLWRVVLSSGEEFLSRSLVLGPGRHPRIPEAFEPHLGSRVFHLNDYLHRLKNMDLAGSSIAVIGASQSAVEIILDLTKRESDIRIHAIHRAFSFRLKDTSPFSDHVYFPEFIDYFYNTAPSSRRQLEQELRATNYSSVDGDVLDELYLRLYEDRLDGASRVELHNSTVVDSVVSDEGGITIELREMHTGATGTITVGAVVLATGFLNLGVGQDHQQFPALLREVADVIALDENGVITVDRRYRVPMKDCEKSALLYLNGLCESTHGLGDAGSFSLVSLRAGEIANDLLGLLDARRAIGTVADAFVDAEMLSGTSAEPVRL